uniref:Uncharacterized protein n=1 Tax=Rhizophora mucronata TaxID=61149 RepID=A0A2P2NNH8_RHIMU
MGVIEGDTSGTKDFSAILTKFFKKNRKKEKF